MQDKKLQLEPDTEKWTGSKLGKEYLKAVYCHPAYLTYMQSTSYEMLGLMNHKLESRLPGEISTPQICRWHYSYSRKWRGTKEPLDEGKRRQWKSWLKTQHSKNQHHGIQCHHFIANRQGKRGNCQVSFSWAPKSLQTVTLATKLKDTCSFEEKLWQT